MSRLGQWTCVLLIALWACPATALKRPCEKPCGDLSCEQEVLTCLLEAGRAKDAAARLKPLLAEQPDNTPLARMLALAYLTSGNGFWAERTLLGALDSHPDDCETRSWLAWVYLAGGDLDLAEERLDEPGCPVKDADVTRWRMLKHLLANAKGEGEDESAALRGIGGGRTAYPEDRELWQQRVRQKTPGWVDPLDMRFEMLLGYTSNASAGSPADPSTNGQASGIGRFDLFSRFVAPVSRNFRPAVEGNVKGHGLTAEAARENSYLDLSIRPGILVGSRWARTLLAYRGNLLVIGLDGKELFYEAHRAELELETDFGLLVFAGAGRRIFVEGGRTRTELDSGLGGTIPIGNRVQLYMALTGRQYMAVADAYDQVGGTALLGGLATVGKGVLLRFGVTPMVDYFPSSGGERGLLAYGIDTKRFDVLVKQYEEVWSPPLAGFRIGFRYEFSWRHSTADRPDNDYNYTEHRILGGIKWSIHLNPFGPKRVSTKDHVSLPYKTEAGGQGVFDEERIQDLLRQDEAARAGSACVD